MMLVTGEKGGKKKKFSGEGERVKYPFPRAVRRGVIAQVAECGQ